MRPKHTGKWTCTNCKKEFKWKQSLYNHKQSCEKGKIPCLNCNKTFSRASYAKVHKCKGKSGNETTCIICKKVFNKMWHLKRHVEAVHKDNGKSSYKCDNCGMVYQRENHYRKHIEKCKSLKKTKTTRQRKAKVSEAGDPDISFPEDSFIPSMLYFVDNNKNEYDERQTVDFNATSSYQENEEEPTVFVLDDFDSFSYECREIHDASIINGEHATPVGSQAFLNKKSSSCGRNLESENDGQETPMRTPRFRKKKTSLGVTPEAEGSVLQTPSKTVQQRTECSVMTPNTRQRKSRLAENHSNFIEGLNLTNHEDVVDVILLSMKKLGLYEKLHFAVRTENSDTIEKRGRKMTSFETRKKVWDFYHQNSTPSTITSRPAKLKVSERHKIQVGLDFVDTVTIIIQRKKQFYENNWMMLHITYYELFLKYNEIHPNNQVSNGTFRVLKPFYVRTETEKDVEMCCCKLHLHARWAIEALINCAAKQNINIQITDYKSFFDILTTNCEKDETAYINWTCTPDKNTYCENIKENWKIISDNLVESSAHNVCVTLTTFEEVEYTKKNGEISSKLKPVSKQSSMVQIVEFISSILSRILHHRNHLKHYRSAVSAFRASFDAVFLDIDFSENLKLPVKFEPQSMHWCHETITVHSGIIKIHGEKSYHPYVSDDKKHDQTFVKKVLKEMIATIECLPQSCIVESDNCSSQYKSAKHFEDLQEICDEIGIPLIRLFSIAGHGKGEVDHVGGLAKCSIRRFVGTGGKVFNAKDCKDYLISKFGDKSNPSIFVKELQQDELSNLRAEARLKQYPTIDGSDSFQVIVFKPNSRSFKAAPRLCTCNICLIEYGSCSLFTEYQLLTYPLNKIYLRSDVVESNHEENDSNTSEEFILPGSYCAVAPDSSSQDSLWFIKIVDTVETNVEITDDYGNRIAPGLSCIEGRFLEKVEASAKGFLFKLSKKKTYFFRESVVYPFVQFTMAKKGYHLSTMEYVEILNYVESNGLSRI